MTSIADDDLLARLVFASTRAAEQTMRKHGALAPLGIAFLGEPASLQVVNSLEDAQAKDLDGEQRRDWVHAQLCAIAGQRSDAVAVSTLLYKRDRGRIYVQVELPETVVQPLVLAVARVNGAWTVSDHWTAFPHFIAAPVFAR